MSKYVKRRTNFARHFYNVLQYIQFEFGAAYRFGDSVSGMMNAKEINIRVGYAYDYNTSNLGNSILEHMKFFCII
jgi:hypothetical protein